MAVRTLDGVDVAGQRVLLRADLNVPVHDGRITDLTRIERLCPTIRELSGNGAKVIICSHFDRPQGKPVPEMSLRPMAEALAEVLGQPVAFAEDCIDLMADMEILMMEDGGVLVLENTRFHPGEEANDPEFAKSLASNGDLFVNDAFSAAHRAHASTAGVAKLLPSYAGRLMQQELEMLDAVLSTPQRPVMAIVGGSKVSTKLELLGNLLTKVNILAITGAMANTFLAEFGTDVGRSLQEEKMRGYAWDIVNRAGAHDCAIILPTDAVIARSLEPGVETWTVPIGEIPADCMILDVGPATVAAIEARLAEARTLVWNGPLGAFETPPFDAATNALAHAVARATKLGKLRSVAGGGDTVSALRTAGVLDDLSYVSSAGGAFLEWLEGKSLPGVAALGG